MSHTPGPWSIVRYGDGSSLVIHSDPDNRVCFMATASSDRPSSHAGIRANANLIAAAPDLYESVRDLLPILEAVRFTAGLGKTQMARIEKAKAAVARANGSAQAPSKGTPE